MSVKRRLVKLEAEAEAALSTETVDEREKRLVMVREGAEQQNERYFREPPFVIADDGTVICGRDGLPRDDRRGVVLGGDGGPTGLGLVYDEETEAFYNRAGEFALSRDFADLLGLMGEDSG